MKLNIDLGEVTSDKVQEFEKSDKNYIQLEVRLPNGEVVANPKYCVNLTMSKDAMIGLAFNLLREAYDPDLSSNQLRMWEFFPALPSGAVEMLGVYTHPRSCEFKIYEGNDGPLKDLIENGTISGVIEQEKK